jgi:hypothetical protein
VAKARRWKPHIVVHLDVEKRLEGMRKQRTGMADVTEVGSVDGSTRKQSWRKQRQGLSGLLEKWSSGRIMTTDKISARAGGFDDFVWAMFAT